MKINFYLFIFIIICSCQEPSKNKNDGSNKSREIGEFILLENQCHEVKKTLINYLIEDFKMKTLDGIEYPKLIELRLLDILIDSVTEVNFNKDVNDWSKDDIEELYKKVNSNLNYSTLYLSNNYTLASVNETTDLSNDTIILKLVILSSGRNCKKFIALVESVIFIDWGMAIFYDLVFERSEWFLVSKRIVWTS